MTQLTHNEGYAYEAKVFLHIWQHVFWARCCHSGDAFAHGGEGGQWSDSYSWGIIFHVNRGWQDIAILLCVKLAVAHIYTRSALQIALKKQKRGYIKTLFFVASTHTHTRNLPVSQFLQKFLWCGGIRIYQNEKKEEKLPRWDMLHKQLPEWPMHLNSSVVQFSKQMVQPVIHKCWCSHAQSRATESPEQDITANCHPGTLITGLGGEWWLRPL